MPHRRRLVFVLVTLFALACGPGERGAGAASAATPDSVPAAPPIAAGTTPRGASGASGAAASPRAGEVSPPRDSAFGPKLEVDSTGKVRPINRPMKRP